MEEVPSNDAPFTTLVAQLDVISYVEDVNKVVPPPPEPGAYEALTELLDQLAVI
jgi:hypothetical protein